MSLPHDGDQVLGSDGRPLAISGPGDRRPLIYGIITAELAVVTIVVVLRFASRRIAKIPLWWDDWLIVPSYLGFLIAMSMSYWQCTRAFLGVHIGLVTFSKLADVGKGFFVGEFPFAVILATMKLSILAFYWRVFGKGGRRLRWTIRALMAFIAAWQTVALILVGLQCRPISGVWDRTVQADCNINFVFLNLAPALINVVTDVIILALPISVCLRIHRSWRTRLALSGIFAFGLLTTVLSILRITVLTMINFKDPLVALDGSWFYVPYILLTFTENACLLVTACLPTLRPVLACIWSKILSQSSKQQGSPLAESGRKVEANPHAPPFSSPWSARVWGIEASQVEEVDGPILNSEAPTKHFVDANIERQLTREASDRSLHPERSQSTL